MDDPVYMTPWPDGPTCEGCKKPAVLSRYDKVLKKTVVTHQDGSQPCQFDGGSGFVSLGGGAVSFPIQTTAEFADLETAKVWAKRRANGEGVAVFLGYIHGHGGHRVIGRLKGKENSLATVEPEEDRS